jgi:hypothetical protein
MYDMMVSSKSVQESHLLPVLYTSDELASYSLVKLFTYLICRSKLHFSVSYVGLHRRDTHVAEQRTWIQPFNC